MSFVTVDLPQKGVARVVLNRPERMNALSVDLASQLLQALQRLSADRSVAAVILTGAGRGFCAGGDVKEMEHNRTKTADQRRADLLMMHRIPAEIAEMPQTVIAAVNGAAYGAGMAIALTCDIVLASDAARFGTAFLKQGLVSDFGLSYQLTRLTGPAQARRMILLDRVLDAREAVNMGLVAEVHPLDALLPVALDRAARVARWPDAARAEMKHLLRQAETATHADMLDAEATVQTRMILSGDHAQAVDAFNHPATPQPKE